MSASPSTVAMATAVVASPLGLLLYRDLISLDDALVRVGICLVLCWVALSVVSALVSTGRAPAARTAPVPVPVAETEASSSATEPVAEAPFDVR